MADSKLEQDWLLHGRTTLDLINSQRTKRDQIKADGFYPYFTRPTKKATEADINNLVETLKGSTWLKLETTL